MSWRASISRNVRSFRFVFDGASPSGQPMRSWLEKNFVEVKTMNPTTQFLIREATTTQPRIIANYDFAQERFISIAGLNEAQIERRLALLVDVGRTLPRILKDPLAFNRHKPTIDFNEHPFADAGFYNNE